LGWLFHLRSSPTLSTFRHSSRGRLDCTSCDSSRDTASQARSGDHAACPAEAIEDRTGNRVARPALTRARRFRRWTGNAAGRRFRMLRRGPDPSDRVRPQKLDEALAVLDGLRRGETFSHDSEFFHMDRVKFVPRAVQSPRVPVWVAGFWPHKPPMRRASRWDGAFPLKMPAVPLAGLTPGAAPLSALCFSRVSGQKQSNWAASHQLWSV
jgi:hypothetical protein